MGPANKKVYGVIQATYKSDLFPGKSMMKIAGVTVLEHIVARLRKVKCLSDIVLATSDLPDDGPLADEANRLRIKVYRGSEYDVLSRLCEAVKQAESEFILKVNGNYPLFDPHAANDLIKEHIKGDFDFSFNEHLNGILSGTGCDIVKKEILLLANKEKLTPEQREAGLLFFHQNQNRFRVNRHPYASPRPHYKLGLDTGKDLKLLEFIFNNLKEPYTGAIIELLDGNQILAESNKYETVKEVGLEKLHLFPQKVASLQEDNFSKTDFTYPISVELSLTNRCNMNCLWCSDKDLRARMRNDMDLDLIKKLLLDLKEGGTKGIVIEGGGEPTLHRSFEDVANFAYELGFGVGLITNGSRKIRKETADKFEWVRVSLDASNSEEQRTLKGSDGFEKTMSNLKSLCSSKATVGVGYVVTSQNTGSLEALILRLLAFGVNYIQFRPVIDHPELETDIDLSYLKRYENRKFSVIIDGMRQNIIKGNDGLPCVSHSLTSVVAADGSVYLCGRLNIYPWFEPMGNINSESFRDIWTGKKRIEQDRQVRDPEFCKVNCPRCRMTKFNRLLHRVTKIKTTNFI